ncbi:MAG: hypothetical protein HZA48_08440 [Planctomycetes bacterium]|nr:hypothetical protein [Planctomycetota bacterium]
MKKVLCAVMLLLSGTGALYAQSTTIYTTVSTDSVGYDRASTTANPPPSPFDSAWQTVTSAAMTNMSANDANWYETRRTTARDQYDSQLFRFKVTQDISLITQLDPRWIGYGEAQASYPCYLYIWNRNTVSWQLIQQQDIGAPDGTLTGAISSNISYYINSDGLAYVAAQAKHYNYGPSIVLSSPGSGSWYTDFNSPTLSWSNTDADNDTMQSYAEIRQPTIPWTSNSGWIAGTSWGIAMPWNGYWYYWRAQVRDGIATSSFTSEWSVGWDWGKSSCPFFYVWDGEKYQYITDIGGSGIGKKDKETSFIKPTYVVMGKNFPEKNGSYEVKIREILREITYLDEAQLWVVDCPIGYEIASSSAEKPSPFKNAFHMPPECEFYAINIKKALLPVSARDNNGNGILPAISSIDGKAAPADEAAEMNYYILDFGTVNADYAKLVFDGWRADILENPVRNGVTGGIELMNDNGKWEKIRDLGEISGDFKTMVIPLKGVFKNRKDHRIKVNNFGKRHHLNMYDRIRLDVSPDIALNFKRIPAGEASLSFAGMPTLDGKGDKEKRILLRDDSNPVNTVNLFKGDFTKYGDVTELLKSTDNHYAVMNSGDQVMLRFKGLATPPAKGMDRVFILKTFLYFKPGVLDPLQTMYPLPFKGMKTYPYSEGDAGYPLTPENKLYLQKYNTREYKTDFLSRSYFDKNLALKCEYMKAVEVPHSLNTNYVEFKVTYTGAGTAPSIPALAYPADAETGVNTDVTFRWTPSSGTSPITYQLQVATDSGFISIVSDTSNISTDFYFVTGLTLGTQYYWQVRGNNTFGTSSWSSVRSFTVGNVPSVPALVTPADASVDIILSPAFGWSASTGESPVTYTLQVDTENTFANPITVDLGGLYVTSYDTTAVLNENTQYYWRVQASNSFGNGGWSAIWSFTTGTKPGTPSLNVPATSSTDVVLPVTLQWNAVAGSPGITYILQVDNDFYFSSPDYNQGYIADTQFTVSSLLSAQIYYWRVKARNDIGESPWSSIWSFATSASAAAPSMPVLSGPANGATDVALNQTLFWDISTGVAPISYTVQIDTNSLFTAPVENTGSTTWYQPSGLAYSTAYYWRVKSFNAIGDNGWTAARLFTTMADPGSGSGGGSAPSNEPPSVPALDMPSNGAEDVEIDLVFGWVPSSGTSPVKYTFRIGLDQSVSQIMFSSNNLSTAFKEVANLPYETMLYWRVKAVNDYGESDWSDVWSFKTKAEATTSGTGGGSASYALIVTTPSAMNVYAQYGSTSATAKKLTIYNGGTANFTWTLQNDTDWMTVNPLTGSSVQVTDVDITIDVSGRPAGVYSGMITVTAENASNSPVSVPVTLYIYNDTSSGSSSTGGSGSTVGAGDAGAPSILNLFSPANGTTGLYPAPKLSWENMAGITYWLEVSNDQGFGTLLVSKTLDAAEYQTTGIQLDTVYYWRVKAVNSSGMSEWSDTWWFKTKSDTDADNEKTPSVKWCFIKKLK